MGIYIDRNDGLSSSVAVKGPCVVITQSNVPLTGLYSHNGVSILANFRVLVANQDNETQNGIYVADSGPWRRAKDFSRNDDVKRGTIVAVVAGTVGQGFWQVTSEDPITIGTTPILFSEYLSLVREAAELWAQSPDPIPPWAGGNGVDDFSAKYWAEVARNYAGGDVDEISAEVDFVAVANRRVNPVLSDTAIAAGKEYVEDGWAVDDGQLILLTANATQSENRIFSYNKAANRLDPWSGMPIGSTLTKPYAVRVKSGNTKTGAVFSLITFGGVVGTTPFQWKDEATGLGVLPPNRVQAGSAIPSGFGKQGAPRRLVNADLPAGRATPNITAWEPTRPAVIGLKVRKISQVVQEGSKWSRATALRIALAECQILEIDEPVYLRSTPPLDLRSKTLVCHGYAVPFIIENPSATVLNLAGADDFSIRGHMHIRYTFRSTGKAIRLDSGSTCGRVRAEIISTEGINNAVYLDGTLTDPVFFEEVSCADYSTDTPITVTTNVNKVGGIPRLPNKRAVGSESLNINKTFIWGREPENYTLTGAMTANRTLTLSSTNAFEGARLTVIHGASGGYSWVIKNAAGTTLITVPNGADPKFVATNGDWALE